MLLYFVIFFYGTSPRVKAYLDSREACRFVLSNASRKPIIFALAGNKLSARVTRRDLIDSHAWSFQMVGEDFEDKTFPMLKEMVCKKQMIHPQPAPAYEEIIIQDAIKGAQK